MAPLLRHWPFNIHRGWPEARRRKTSISAAGRWLAVMPFHPEVAGVHHRAGGWMITSQYDGDGIQLTIT